MQRQPEDRHVVDISHNGAHVSSSPPPSNSNETHQNTRISIEVACRTFVSIFSIYVLVESRHEQEQQKHQWVAWISSYVAGCALFFSLAYWKFYPPHPRFRRLLNYLYWLLELYFVCWFATGFYLFKDTSPTSPLSGFSFCMIPFNCGMYYGLFFGAFSDWSNSTEEIRRAPTKTINFLPTYRFKLQQRGSQSGQFDEDENEFGVVAVGTEKERILSSDDASCCIFLGIYDDNDVLIELPCSHLFHASCVNKWLKIEAFCPLCRRLVHTKIKRSSSAPNLLERRASLN